MTKSGGSEILAHHRGEQLNCSISIGDTEMALNRKGEGVLTGNAHSKCARVNEPRLPRKVPTKGL